VAGEEEGDLAGEYVLKNGALICTVSGNNRKQAGCSETGTLPHSVLVTGSLLHGVTQKPG